MIKRISIIFSLIILIILLFSSVNNLFALDRGSFLIAIDAGHGGSDPGAIGPSGYQEKVANLAIAEKLKNRLSQAGYRVIMTRNGDETKSLGQRVDFVNNSGADLLISIHNNAWVLPTANGTETYWCPSNNGYSSYAASYIHSSLVSSIGRKDRGVKTSDFYILKNTKIPAILLECVFISNPEEESLLKSNSFQDKVVQGIFSGVEKYFNSNLNFNQMKVWIDYPTSGQTISGTYNIYGWALDLNSTSGTGIDKVSLYLDGAMGSGSLLGDATFYARPGLAEVYKNEQLVNSGFKFSWDTTAVSKGTHILYAYAHSPTYGWVYTTRKVNVEGITNQMKVWIDYPTSGQTISGTYNIYGWALDLNSTSGTGIDKVSLYLDGAMGSGSLLGDATFYARPGLAEVYKNEQLVNSGFKFSWDTTAVSKGTHILYAYAHSPTYGWIYTTRKVNVGIEEVTIDNSTNVIGKATATEEQLLSLFISRNSNQIDRARRLAPLYIKWGNTFNIRYDIPWAMMCHETGFLQFGGIVPPDANNFCGLGATGAKDENGNYIYNSFATEELGVIAQYIHLAWYIYPDHLTLKDSNGDLYCSTKYDPRHFGTGHNYNGDSTLGTLNERWAPSTTYTAKIILFANEIYN